jgi:voltage-gated potassium channel
VMVMILVVDRDGYKDSYDGSVDLIDAIYYATVTLTTTGYGDITPVTPTARLVNAFIVTPLRIAFLVVLVGTTLEVLANEGRRIMRDTRWRKRMKDHTIVVGYGTKGRAAVQTLISNGVKRDEIVVIDPRAQAIGDAGNDQMAAFHGDATNRTVLRRAEVMTARTRTSWSRSARRTTCRCCGRAARTPWSPRRRRSAGCSACPRSARTSAK